VLASLIVIWACTLFFLKNRKRAPISQKSHNL
jgi:hypothetical protein